MSNDTHTEENSKIYCKHVIVKVLLYDLCTFSLHTNLYVIKEDEYGGDGAYAAKDFQQDELIEKGIIRPYYGSGEENPFVFTWSDDRTKWGMGSAKSVSI